MQRRKFIRFLGQGTVSTALLPPFISACATSSEKAADGESSGINKALEAIKGTMPSAADELVLAEGLHYDVLIGFGDPISEKDTFGFNNDYLAFIPTDKPDEAILWSNHEYVNPMFVSDYQGGEKSEEQIKTEMYNIGGSLMGIKKVDGRWQPALDSGFGRKVNALTMIPFNWDEAVAGKNEAMGTLQNCAGGITPWGTVLTCEENYQYCYGERDFDSGEVVGLDRGYGWYKLYDNPPEHYGWVVEVNPQTGEAQKHVALGRCAHECATTVELPDHRVAVYTGDDKNDECLYKFISSKPGSLKEGTLYVANLEKGEWVPLDWASEPKLQEKFESQTEVLIRLREAAALMGGTPLARPEDIEIDPVTGNVLVALTNNIPKENYFGQILKITENGGAYDALTFTSEVFLAGGEETGFACPDNMAFDRAGNLWFTSDISGSKMNKPPYEAFKNNGLFVVPRQGEQAGQVIQMASAPTDAELTGPFFAPDGKTLFLSVQHPGERSKSLEELTSHWPDGGNSVPRPCVVTIEGELLDKLQGLS